MAQIQLPKNAPNPDDFQGFALWKQFLAWEKLVNEKLKPFGVSQSECFHLISLWGLQQKQQEVTQNQLSVAIAGSSMNTSKTLKNLEKKSMIIRKKAKDSRAKSVVISEVGKQVLLESVDVLAAAHQQFFTKN